MSPPRNIPIMIVIDRDKEIEQHGSCLKHRIVIFYTGYPYKRMSVIFRSKIFKGRKLNGYVHDTWVTLEKGLNYFCFCAPICMLLEKLAVGRIPIERVPSTWIGNIEGLTGERFLCITHEIKQVIKEKIPSETPPPYRTLKNIILRWLVFHGISREDIPDGLLPQHVKEELYEIHKGNPAIGRLGPICSHEEHSYKDTGLRARYLPQIRQPSAPPPGEGGSAGRSGPHP